VTDTPLFTTYPTQAGVQYKFTVDPVPFVNVPASQARALRVRNGGAWKQWAEHTLAALDRCGEQGATWQELGEWLNLHHGQISGRLSTLHDMGEVFTLRKTRNGSHPYVHAKYRDDFKPEARRDRPAKTKAKKLSEVLDEIKAAAQAVRAAEHEHHFLRENVLQNLLAMIEEAG
jgi:hypothetical protein